MKPQDIFDKDFWKEKIGEVFDRVAGPFQRQPELIPIPVENRNRKPAPRNDRGYRR
jgi:hypothetical protein